ncbi:MAG: efflux RND transporter permease subunit [Treponema sp.]|nr:efflux RND transporter permease subunit [Treponema sp.]
MKTLKFLQRKKMSLCILAGICAVSVFVHITSQEKINQNTGGSYAVKIKHHGIDAAEMERSVTIPLEDAIFSIPGVSTVQSSSENSVSNIFVRFRPGLHGRYEAVRDAAQRIYETLPSSAQRPEIYSSNNSRVPVWSAAVISDNFNGENDLFLAAQMLEKTVKPRLESLEGAGEVIISGSGLKEIFIIFDQEKISNIGLEPSAAASFLGMNDSIFSGGTIIQSGKEVILTVDGRYSSLKNALIPLGNGKYTELSDIAEITEHEREPEIYSRLNGKKTASIAVMGRSDADLRRLSSDIKKELAALSALENQIKSEFIVLSDLGAEEKAAFNSVLYAAISGAIMVALISLLLNRKNNTNAAGIFCALSIPLICLISLAVLSICGFSLNGFLLAGIAAGSGTAIDAVILCSEKLRKCLNYKTASAALSSLAGPLLAGAATTVVALIPLYSIENNGVKIIASAISAVTVTSLVLSLTLLPPLLLWGLNSNSQRRVFHAPRLIKHTAGRISRYFCRFLAAAIKFCSCYPIVILSAFFAITIFAVILLFAKGADTGSYSSQDSVYAQVEFKGGFLAQEIDKLLSSYGEKLIKMPGIKNVETGARTGSGSILISFNPNITQAHLVRETAKQINIPGGFIFFHEDSLKEYFWEIFIYGDEDKKCREIAEELAHICALNPLIKERVLNFKQGSNKIIFLPDREIFSKSKISFSAAANRIRLGVYGPVAYKRLVSGAETDVRIRTGDDTLRQSREGLMNLLVSSMNEENISYLPVDSLFNYKEETEPSSIRRDNRRRYASITVSTKPMDPRRVKQELAVLFQKLDLPPGYSIEFDPDAIKKSGDLSRTILSLLTAIVFCYMIIASINESYSIPLLVLSVIPASLSLPAIFLVLSGSAYNQAAACAFIAVSGMTVNAAILCADSIRVKLGSRIKKTSLSLYCAVRLKIPALLSTTGTTVAGAIPFLFLSEGANGLIRALSFTGALGVASSCLCSILIIPSILSISKYFFNKQKSIPLVRD